MSSAGSMSEMAALAPMQPLPEWQVSRWFNHDTGLALSDLRGKVVLLHAFQMLCPGCVSHALPQAERIHREFANKRLQVVGLHTVFEHHGAMAPEALAAFLHEYRISHPIGVDQEAVGSNVPRSMARYALRGTPSLLLIDPAGRLRFSHFGRLDDLRLGWLLGQLLAEAGSNQTGQTTATSPAETDCSAHGCPLP